MNNPAHIYLLATERGEIKLGITTNLDRRMRDFRSHLPQRFVLLRAWLHEDFATIEQQLIEKYRDHQLPDKTEWFLMPWEALTALITEMDDLCQFSFSPSPSS